MLTVYSKNHCPYCDKAKQLLSNKGIEYKIVNIDEDPEAKTWLIDQGHRAVPQIYKDGALFVEGGYQGLAKLSDTELKGRAEELTWQI